MDSKLTLVLRVCIAIITISSLSYFVNIEFYNLLIEEDGALENITAYGMLVGSLLLLVRFIRVYKTKNKLWIILNILMILGLIFGFGEEISWGQRILEVESSEFFSQNNAQNETNLHNLKVGDVKVNKIFSLILTSVFGIYFLFVLLIYKKSTFLRKLLDDFGVPLPTVAQSIWFIAATIIIVAIPNSKKWEIWECIFVLTFLWILIAPYNIKEKLFPTKE